LAAATVRPESELKNSGVYSPIALADSVPDDLRSTCETVLKAGHDRRELSLLLSRNAGSDSRSAKPIQEIKAQLGMAAEDDSLERLMIRLRAEDALGQIDELPVHPFVKKSIESDIRALLTAREPLTAGTYNFARAAKLVTLRRFPAGPMEWEVSGIPRSWLFRAGFADFFRLATFVMTRLGGFQPCFFMHVAPRPRSLALVLEKEVMRAYYRMARSLELQPGVRGIVASAWFHDPKAVADNPHLEALSRPYTQHGGAIVLLEKVDESSGVLEGSPKRRMLYEQGLLSYRNGLALWPRAQVLAWAEAHPEYQG
jgi:hypothetical protein